MWAGVGAGALADDLYTRNLESRLMAPQLLFTYVTYLKTLNYRTLNTLPLALLTSKIEMY